VDGRVSLQLRLIILSLPVVVRVLGEVQAPAVVAVGVLFREISQLLPALLIRSLLAQVLPLFQIPPTPPHAHLAQILYLVVLRLSVVAAVLVGI
jgi:hypothetical protein